MNPLEKLEKLFMDFPGIGPRQAKRFVYFLLGRRETFLNELKYLIDHLKDEILVCKSCFRFFIKGKNPTTICNICSDKGREKGVLMVVSRDVDLENFEKTSSYHGQYFVLGGVIPILEKEPEKRVRLKEFIERVKKEAEAENLKEVIFALNANPEGENTEDYLKEKLAEFPSLSKIKISTLGRGLSTGLELEYSDAETLKNALKNRG